MFWYRLGAALLILTIAAGFFYWEYKFFPERIEKSIKAPIASRIKTIPYKPFLAPPAPKIPKVITGQRAIAFKRAFEEPEGFQLTPPLMDNLVTPSRLETIEPLKQSPRQDLFPIPNQIKMAVNFWKNIYSKYTSLEAVIHDKRHLNVIYDEIDFTSLKQEGLSNEEIQSFMKNHTSERVAEIDRALEYLDKIKYQSHRLNPLEAKIWKLWSFRNDDPDRFAKARDEIRIQTGMRNQFERALQLSGIYLTYMEDIFQSYQMPPEITRLVFVESMFNNNAFSRSGAAGLWQFIPRTAKRFMKVNEWVDERYDPFIATDAAAQLLRENYNYLGSWPLAINAYNTGIGRIKQAIRRLGTDNIGVIISKFRGRGYGFASRNFYPSFIAALEIAENYRQIFGDLPIYEPITYEIIKLPAQARIVDIAEILELDVASIHDLNPAFQDTIFQTNIYLPRGAAIRVPLGDGADVIAGVYNLAKRATFPQKTSKEKITETQ